MRVWYQALTSGELDVEFGCTETWIKAEIFVSTSTMQYGCKQLSAGKYRYERLTYRNPLHNGPVMSERDG